jgi:hypothetical protein
MFCMQLYSKLGQGWRIYDDLIGASDFTFLPQNHFCQVNMILKIAKLSSLAQISNITNESIHNYLKIFYIFNDTSKVILGSQN